MKFLYEGTITNQALRKTQAMHMKRLYLEDLPVIEQVQKRSSIRSRKKRFYSHYRRKSFSLSSTNGAC
nr:hypothetical protein [Planococcus glaciei]